MSQMDIFLHGQTAQIIDSEFCDGWEDARTRSTFVGSVDGGGEKETTRGGDGGGGGT